VPEYVHPITAKGPTYVGSKLVYQGEAVQSDVPINYVDPPAVATLDADGLPPDVSVATWAALQAIPVGRRVVGRRYGVRQPVCTNGTHGTIWVWTGTLFRPAGRQLVFSSNALVQLASADANRRVIRSSQFEAGPLAGVRLVNVSAGFDRNVADPAGGSVRALLGPSGNTSDATIDTVGWGATLLQFNQRWGFSPISSTLISNRPNNGAINGLDSQSASSTSRSAGVSVASLDTTPMFLSVEVQQGASPVALPSSPYMYVWVE